MKRNFLAGLMLMAVLPFVAGAQMAGKTLSQAAVFTAFKTVKPGDLLPLAVRLTMADGWHTYAEEPGDSGMPPSILIKGPEGLEQQAWRFPPPEKFTDRSGTTYGYEKSVVLIGCVHIPASLPEGKTIELTAELQWMICRDLCIFLQDEQTLTVQTGAVSSEPSPEWTAQLETGGWADLIKSGQGTAVPGKEP
jgi:thiol:disulfide interchange protein DsbD